MAFNIICFLANSCIYCKGSKPFGSPSGHLSSVILWNYVPWQGQSAIRIAYFTLDCQSYAKAY
jgi:hypothetical protein